MGKENILENGVWELHKLKEQIETLEQYKAELVKKDVEEDRLEQELEVKEKMIQDEIQMVVQKREHEIALSFDEQVNRLKTKSKKVSAKKEKTKSERVNERILQETREFREDNAKLNQEVKSVLQQGHVSKFCNNRVYYALFAPKGISDYLIAALSILIVSLLLPNSIFYLFFAKSSFWVHALLYFICIGLAVGAYYVIYQKTRMKNPTAIATGQTIRFKMRQNNAKMRKIKNRIIKDKDESGYELQQFDQQLREIESSIADILKQKTEALTVLKNSTSHILAKEVRTKHEDAISDLKRQYDEVHQKNKEMEDKVKEITRILANEYEAYLGKEFMNGKSIDDLIRIMEQNDLYVVSEAISIYRKEQENQQVS